MVLSRQKWLEMSLGISSGLTQTADVGLAALLPTFSLPPPVVKVSQKQ